MAWETVKSETHIWLVQEQDRVGYDDAVRIAEAEGPKGLERRLKQALLR